MKNLVLTLCFLSTLNLLNGQNVNLGDIPDVYTYFATYDDKHNIIMSEINSGNRTLTQRLKLYNKLMDSLKEAFKAERRIDYERVNITLSKKHTCTKGYSGGTKDCGTKYLHAPSDEFYTIEAWAVTKYWDSGKPKKIVGTSISNQGRTLSIHLRKSGKGKNNRLVEATFRLTPESILTRLDNDTKTIFNRIADSND